MKSNLEKIDDFNNLSEFNRFIDWIYERVDMHTIKEVPVKIPYMGTASLEEKWFLHIESDEVWRLVWPDSPFTGIFEPVILTY